jgi:hypothetical protein
MRACPCHFPSRRCWPCHVTVKNAHDGSPHRRACVRHLIPGNPCCRPRRADDSGAAEQRGPLPARLWLFDRVQLRTDPCTQPITSDYPQGRDGPTDPAGAAPQGNGLYKVAPPPGGKIVRGACEQGIRTAGGGQSCWWWSQGCSIGCKECATSLIGPNGSAGGNPPHSDKIGFRKRFCNASWNSAGAPVPMINSTLPRAAWTMNVDAVAGEDEDSYRYNPWRAPGHAPVVDVSSPPTYANRTPSPALLH